MNYTPTTWKTGDKISSAGLNNIEQGIAALYPQEIIIAPEQTVTITSETDPTYGEMIVLADGYNLPAKIPEGWTVTVNGTVLDYYRGSYVHVDGTTGTVVSFAENKLILSVTDGIDPASATPIPGNYTVKIIEAAQESGGILLVKNNGGVLDKTAAEIWSAMQTGLVLIDFGDGVSHLTFNFIHDASHESGYTFTTTPSDVTYTAASDDDYPQTEKS